MDEAVNRKRLPEETNWQWLKPRLIDAGIIATGMGTGAGLGLMLGEAASKSRLGSWWHNLPPETKMKYLIPATALSGIGYLGLNMMQDYHRYSPDKDRPEPKIIGKNA